MRVLFFSIVCVLPLFGFSYEFASSYEQWIDRKNNFIEYCDEIDGARVISMESGLVSLDGIVPRVTRSYDMFEALFLSYLYDNQQMFDKFLRFVLFASEKSEVEHLFCCPEMVDKNGNSFLYLADEQQVKDSKKPHFYADRRISVSLFLASKKVETGEWKESFFNTCEGQLNYQQIYEKMDLIRNKEDVKNPYDGAKITCNFTNKTDCILAVEAISGNGIFTIEGTEKVGNQVIDDFIVMPGQTVNLLFRSIPKQMGSIHGTFSFQYCCQDGNGNNLAEGKIFADSYLGDSWWIKYGKTTDYRWNYDLMSVDNLSLSVIKGWFGSVYFNYEDVQSPNNKTFMAKSMLKEIWTQELSFFLNLGFNRIEDELFADRRCVNYSIVQYQPSSFDPIGDSEACDDAIWTLLNRAIAEKRLSDDIFEIVLEYDPTI